ncbi:MAG: glycosyltransferase family 39 protein [Candidatus Omnitrophica bacterium]|nr:glycosyltransferase family 39 protein [Candidatus Omnitrophota bacterium]
MNRKTFLLILLLFLGLRLAILLTAVESVSWTSWGEELYRGTIARELIQGLKAPFLDYQSDGYDGGSLLVGILAVPFFLLLGPNLFALKLVPLALSLAALILSFFFFRRFFDRKAALWVCLLQALSPPVFTSLSLVAIGSHVDSIPFSVAILFSFYRFLYGEKGRIASLILFGLAAGLGFWFTPMTGITTVTCLTSWLLLDRRSFFSGRALVFLGSFGVGALPFLLYNVRTHFRFVGFLEYSFLWRQGLWGDLSLGEKLLAVPVRLFTLLFQTLPSLFCFRIPEGPHLLLTLLYGLIAWSLIVPFLWRGIGKSVPVLRGALREGRWAPRSLEEAKRVPLLLFPMAFILIYSASNYPPVPPPYENESFTSFRYFSPLYLPLFFLLAMALRSRRRLFPYLLTLLILGAVGQGSLLFREPWGRAFHYQGTSYLQMGDVWGNWVSRFPDRFDEFQRLAGRFSARERRRLYWGLSYTLATMGRSADPGIERMARDPQGALQAIRRVPPEYRIYFLENWGRYVARLPGEEFDRALGLGRLLSEEEVPYFYFGLSTKVVPGLHHSIAEEKKSKEAAVGIPASVGGEEKAWFYRGMGMEAGRQWIPAHSFPGAFDSLVLETSPEDRRELFWGIGWGIGWGSWVQHTHDRRRLLDWIDRLPVEMRRPALQGFEALEVWYRIA